MNDIRKKHFGGLSLAMLLAGVSVSNLAAAASLVGVLIGGGGIDNMRVDVRDATGRVISAYCLERCGNIFTEPDANDIVNVRDRYLKRKVKLEYYRDMNKGRIAGPGEERLEFVKKLEILR